MDIRSELKAHEIKYTKQREEVLSILKASMLPMTINQLRDQLEVEMDLSTIYRILDVLLEKEIITKTVPLEPSQALYDYKRHIHKHHLICTICGKIQIIEGCPLHDYEHQVEAKTQYIIDRHQLELYGVCPNCQIH
ncbi:transcriptional repressor [Erysipelothrix sp. HDW6C]|uniref:Fur family transcriptional regulator n=1 Tax=Erysipelothrix sp. HDW6C TaxID=2714930 RepID=UPI001408D826|nr:Fur family transcriptional regulator [Erysipelothrix sp. HDW6C]QIK69105.1 transcriptional repressor [Erysipelothrix sp. HDW6C]